MDEVDTTLSHCHDLSDALNDEGLDQLCCDLNGVTRKKKYSISNSKGKVNRLLKKPKTPSKVVL